MVRMERWVENVALSGRTWRNRNFYSESLVEGNDFGFLYVDVVILYGMYRKVTLVV
jgi:hypothetical protein